MIAQSIFAKANRTGVFIQTLMRRHYTQGFFKRTFESPDGQWVMRYLMRQFWMTRPMTGKVLNPLELAYREGQRSVVLGIQRHLSIDFVKQIEQVQSEEQNHEDTIQ